MNRNTHVSGMLLMFFVVMPMLITGCGETNTETSNEEHKEPETGHVHGEWWCSGHGVPEGECTRCHSQLIAQYKDEGDWCEEHGLPDSQCFKCHPELEAKFAARYVAKYGKQPPKPTE